MGDMNRKTLKKKIRLLQCELEEVANRWRQDPDYLRYTALAEEAKQSAIARHQAEGQQLAQEIARLMQMGADSAVVEKVAMPETVQDAVDRMHRGVNFGPAGLVSIRVWDERFVLLKRPGHRGWVGRGASEYWPTRYTLHDLSLGGEGSSGIRLYDATLVCDFKGTHGSSALNVVKRAAAEIGKLLAKVEAGGEVTAAN